MHGFQPAMSLKLKSSLDVAFLFNTPLLSSIEQPSVMRVAKKALSEETVIGPEVGMQGMIICRKLV